MGFGVAATLFASLAGYGLMSWLMDLGAAAKTRALARLVEAENARRALAAQPGGSADGR